MFLYFIFVKIKYISKYTLNSPKPFKKPSQKPSQREHK